MKNKNISIRTHKPGDMGYIIHRHGVLYFKEYGWDERFEALVARISADFIDNYMLNRDSCFIAEVDGEFAGCAVIVHTETEENAKFRLLLVEPKFRGLGIATQLVNTCIDFARNAGYKKITLWTNDVLLEAKIIYKKCGFKLIDEEEHNSFGKNLVGETWELIIANRAD